MIKKLALLSTVLLAGCSTVSTENTSTTPANKNLQSAAKTMPESNAQITNTSNSPSKNTEQPTKQQNIDSSPTITKASNKNDEPSNASTQAVVNGSITTSSNQSPITMLDKSILTIQTILKKKSDEINNNPEELKSVIDKYLLPNVDTNKVAAMMLGPKWRTATKQQKTRFINQFLTLLTNIYAKNVAKVGAYEVTFNSLPTEAWKGKKYVQVTGKVINITSQNESGSNITVYIINDDNKWKIYDIAIEGISIMQNYQSQFRPISSMNDVIKGVERVNARTKG